MEQNRPSVKWFIETQSKWFVENGIPEWFHGVITRKEAENLLKDKTPGCFLIRVSESRIGYSLSYRTADRYRHFMIDILKDQQCIIGGDMKIHLTLEHLVKFHTQFPLHPYNEILTIPCGQLTNSAKDYEELFEDSKTFTTPFPIASEVSSVILEPACPPVPPRRCQVPQTIPESTSTPNQPVNRLYPALPTISDSSNLVLPNSHPAMSRSYSLDQSIPTAALNTNCEVKHEEKQGQGPVKPLKACRNAMTRVVSLVTEGEIAKDLKKMENSMATHLRNVHGNFGRFGQTGQKDGSPTLQHKNKKTTMPEEYKTPPPYAPEFC